MIDRSRPTIRTGSSVVTALMNEALAMAQGSASAPRTIQVSIIEHQVSLKGVPGRWHAITRFRASLLEGQRLLATWKAAGEDRRLNALPAYIDADQASQEAFERAIADLMAQLAAGPRQ